jgi:soluble lytic murein transglycosylase-like protein
MGVLLGGFVTTAEAAPNAPQNAPIPPPRPMIARDQARDLDQAQDLGSKKENAEARAAGTAAATLQRAGRDIYRALLKKEAEKNGLPPDIADSVAAIESGYDPSVVGGAGEIGLMQVLPGTAAMLGFKGDLAELAKPEVNIRFGVAYLAGAWRLANGDLCRALMKYRAGHGEETMSPLSIAYCGRARAHLAAIGSPFAIGVSAPMGFDRFEPRDRSLPPLPPSAKRGPRIRTAAVSQAFWAAHEARVKAITARIESKWRKVASR